MTLVPLLIALWLAAYFILRDINKRRKKKFRLPLWPRIRDFIHAMPYRLLSYRKRTWEFEDYPVTVAKLKKPADDKYPYSARIINWHGIIAWGESKTAARNALRDKLEVYKKKAALPRPGVKVPLKFSSTEQMDRYRGVWNDFFDKVMCGYFSRVYPDVFFVSDDSYLEYYEPSKDAEKAAKQRQAIIARTLEIYGVDIKDYYQRPIFEVMAYIKTQVFTKAAIVKQFVLDGTAFQPAKSSCCTLEAYCRKKPWACRTFMLLKISSE